MVLHFFSGCNTKKDMGYIFRGNCWVKILVRGMQDWISVSAKSNSSVTEDEVKFHS